MMKAHEFANIFPLMNSKEFNELKKDIKENGLLEPITLFENQILDGRNRYNVCEELKIECKTKEYRGKDALQYVMSTNLKRRYLTDSQKAVVGRRWKRYYARFAKERMDAGKPSELVHKGRASDKAGEVVGVSGRYIDIADEVIKAKPEMEKKIMSGEIKLKQAYRNLKLEQQKKEIEELKGVIGEYEVIVIDPPWKYNAKYDPDGRRGSGAYPEMDIKELRQIKLPAAKNCVLWCWVTNNFMVEAHELIKYWGFEMKTILTWDKKIIGLGAWLRNKTEHCILAIKGKPVWDNKTYTTLISEQRTAHSVKPESFYKMVEKICYGKKLDYFARQERKGWDVYGDEVTSTRN